MFLVILFTFILLFIFQQLYWKRRNLPPGPMPIPFIGNMLSFVHNAPGYEYWRKCTESYGPIFTFWQSSTPVVVLTDYELIKKTFIKDASKYAGRSPPALMKEMRGGHYGIVPTQGELWAEQRKFTLHVLRDFGMGRNLMEEKVQLEVKYFLETIEMNAKNGPIDIQDTIDASVGSIINQMLFGYRYDESNMEEFLELKNGLSRHFANLGHPAVALLRNFPILGKFPYFSHYYGVVMKHRDNLHGLFRRQISIHSKDIDFSTTDSSDYVEAYLKKQLENKSLPDYGGFSEIQLINVCNDLWIAGMETTANTLYWGILYVMRDDEIQKKIHQEMDNILGDQDVIIASDRNKLHYVNAVVHEVQRMANLVPYNILHTTTEDVEIMGYKITKGTAIVPQISAVLYDEKFFPDAYKFDPTRHLNSDGTFRKIDELIPFSIGKRACLGEGLARLELFLFLANFFHRFQMKPVDINNLPSIRKRMGATMKAENYQIKLKLRNEV